MAEFSEGWQEKQNILVILAHPDDPEFFCGATIYRWARLGHQVKYCLLTHGDKGAQDRSLLPEELALIRRKEQIAAASILGVHDIRFLDYLDGTLEPSLATRKNITRVIREEKPDILITCDPTNFFPNEMTINHPDHRAAGQIVLEAVFPAAGNPMFFPELLVEGLNPHSVKEVWCSLTSVPNTIIDVTMDWETKLAALHEHKSQIGDLEKFDLRMRSRHTADSTDENPRYEEKFRRIVYR